jgi:hypothetical protein
MGIEVSVVVPSHKRAGRVVTGECIDNAIVCVPDSQYKAYKKAQPELEYIAHPDSVKGLTAKRQWIYEEFGNVFMIDDDVKHFKRMYTEKGEEDTLTSEEAYWVVQWAANMAHMMGAYLFGFNKDANPAAYLEMRPIRLTGYVGGVIGMLEGSDLYYDTGQSVVEDYWICALNAYKHRYMFIDTRFSTVGKDTFGNAGGCAEYRTKDLERDDTLWLRKKFGEAIALKEDTGLSTRKHEYMRTLKLPF